MDVLESRLVSSKRPTQVNISMARGWQFFRDPDVIGALAQNEKPACNGCQRDGLIVDHTFEVLKPEHPDFNVLDMQDYDDWGVFVVFTDCNCCVSKPHEAGMKGPGYTFVPKAPIECLLSSMDED
jgi:hypothetical protein